MPSCARLAEDARKTEGMEPGLQRPDLHARRQKVLAKRISVGADLSAIVLAL